MQNVITILTNLSDKMSTGIHKGQTIKFVIQNYPGYARWICANECSIMKVSQTIKDYYRTWINLSK